MENLNIKFDHYKSRFNYLRFIMERLNKSEVEHTIVGEVFNTVLSNMDSREIDEMVIYSSLFESKVLKMGEDEQAELLNNLYDCYIKSMMVHFSNNDVEALSFFYKRLEEIIKIISCYYGTYGEEGFLNYFDKKIIRTK